MKGPDYNDLSMQVDSKARILTINSGSSSLKVAVFEIGQGESLILSGRVERIGIDPSTYEIYGAGKEQLAREEVHLPDHPAAIRKLFGYLKSQPATEQLDAVGHRVVHGGAKYHHPERITPGLTEELRKLIPLAPNHLPSEIQAIEAIGKLYPGLTQVACFDTAFHRSMPNVAQWYGLPRHFEEEGILRYGFHGLSYEYILSRLRTEVGDEVADGRVIVAHLGNGCSMAAVHHGKSCDTTMGFTPTSGLVMSTRCGDLDPAVVLHLMESYGMDRKQVHALITQKSGLLGVSGFSSDMQELLHREDRDSAAAEAVELFCYRARKHAAALTAALGGLDTLVFTGGIGENSPAIRSRICRGLEFLGVDIEAARNQENSEVVSSDGSRVTVRVIKTNEELMIARHTRSLVGSRETVAGS